jgi:hypothetical protein
VTGPALAGPFNDPGHDPLTMSAWATAIDAFSPGPVDIANPGLGVADFGLPANALGPATNDPFDVCSLGDGGEITLFFADGIGNGIGDDFAVYENGFFTPGGLFAEFAFVEVSSNGIDFARFLSTSLHATPVSSFASVDPTDYDNLAGDQPLDLGTGFDLAELANHPLVFAGLLNPIDIQYVRLIDVVGDGSRLDGLGQPIFDPYATAFASGGFDIDAVGVLNTAPEPGFATMLGVGVVGLAMLSVRDRGKRRCASIAP